MLQLFDSAYSTLFTGVLIVGAILIYMVATMVASRRARKKAAEAPAPLPEAVESVCAPADGLPSQEEGSEELAAVIAAALAAFCADTAGSPAPRAGRTTRARSAWSMAGLAQNIRG